MAFGITLDRVEESPSEERPNLWWKVRRHWIFLPIFPFVHRAKQYILQDGSKETDYSVHSVRPGFLHKISDGKHPVSWVELWSTAKGTVGGSEDFFWQREGKIIKARGEAISNYLASL